METRRKLLTPGLELDVVKLCLAVEAECTARKMTRTRMIKELGVDTTTWYSWRRGEYGMNGSALLRVFAWLGLDREVRQFARMPAAKTKVA